MDQKEKPEYVDNEPYKNLKTQSLDSQITQDLQKNDTAYIIM